MDAGAYKILESATQRTLHAQNFSRSSSQASHALTDLLARYLTLVSTTCAKYAQHAGRLNLTARDASCAFEELGVSMEELEDYCNTEGKELGRYSVQTTRRMEDLNEFKAALADGLRQDRDAIPLVYAPLSTATLSEEGEESEDAEDEMDVDDVEALPRLLEAVPRHIATPSPPPPPSTPPLPLSPISNPASPARKRPRTSNWEPPAHIPDFLPPFPTDHNTPDPSAPPSPSIPPLHLPPAATVTRPISPPHPLTSTTSSDYLTPIPYSASSLSSLPEWHLPEPPQLTHELAHPRPFSHPTPQIQQSLISAYHHILTHPPSPATHSANPAKHKAALALITQAQTTPRWEPPDTLFSSVSPCPPRVVPMPPSFAMPLGSTPVINDPKTGKPQDPKQEKKPILPSAPPKFVVSSERITPLISQQGSLLPELARQILPSSVYVRTTRLGHPPPLERDSQKLFYGPPVPAPWNSTGPPIVAPTPTVGKAKESAPPDGVAPKILPDARYYATWDYEQKRYNEALPTSVRRGRMASFSTSTISLGGPSGRARNGSRAA
ncbi:hypothetical protein JAAARDRAFT_181901 [Jaapia argillacea MUCL 33604]|uniref:Bromodomain associated domain-containing protein n=1 Tax=Jaapia argillacea MUCL 33604 TaxID=933084 RepID=A0A067PKX0_9AGAM|nr:hypothetical protein JAAARDRAFT_181901 [Jaapia argillacea MUCL 33604]